MTLDQEIMFFKAEAEKMASVFAAKRHDYGPSTTLTWQKFGPVSMLTRMNDKMNRLEQLLLSTEPAKVKDESVEDTARDLANYALILLIELQKQKEAQNGYGLQTDQDRTCVDGRDGGESSGTCCPNGTTVARRTGLK